MTHHDVTEGMREFRPGVSCEHNWIPAEDFCNPEVPGLAQCLLCGATCVRAADGTIEEYDSAEF